MWTTLVGGSHSFSKTQWSSSQTIRQASSFERFLTLPLLLSWPYYIADLEMVGFTKTSIISATDMAPRWLWSKPSLDAFVEVTPRSAGEALLQASISSMPLPLYSPLIYWHDLVCKIVRRRYITERLRGRALEEARWSSSGNQWTRKMRVGAW